MLLDDSLEFEAISPSKQAKLVPMLKWNDIQLSSIWIPSGLLLNRQGYSRTFSNEHKSAISHTLVKHKAVDSLSVYPDIEIGKSSCSSSEKLLDSLEELPQNYHTTGHAQLQKVNEEKYSQSVLSSDCTSTFKSDIVDVNEEENETFLDENFDSPENSIADYLEHLNISDDEKENASTEIINEPYNQEINVRTQNDSSNIESLEVFDNKNSATVMHDVNYLEHLNISDDEEDNSSIKSIDELKNQKNPVSAQKDSNGAKLLQTNKESVADAPFMCDIPIKAYPCTLSEEVDQNSEIFAELASFLDPDQMVDIVELSEKMWNDSQLNNESPSAETEDFSQIDGIRRSSSESTILEKSSSVTQNPDGFNEKKTCSEEPVEVKEFSFLLQKSNDDLSTAANNEKNSKKEKKLKKKVSKKVVPLDNFFLSKEEASSEVPKEFLEFEESLRKKLGNPYASGQNNPNLNTVFPSLTELNMVEKSNCVESDSLSFIKNPVLDSRSFNCNLSESVMEDESNVTKYVIENIPLFVDEEMLHSLILQYGEVMKVTLKQCGKTLKAVIAINIDDPNWIIECLNGYQPFGASAGEGLKCYQIL